MFRTVWSHEMLIASVTQALSAQSQSSVRQWLLSATLKLHLSSWETVQRSIPRGRVKHSVVRCMFHSVGHFKTSNLFPVLGGKAQQLWAPIMRYGRCIGKISPRLPVLTLLSRCLIVSRKLNLFIFYSTFWTRQMICLIISESKYFASILRLLNVTNSNIEKLVVLS